MNRRERILTALRGGVPDRPPIAFDYRPHSLDGVFRHYGATSKNGLYLMAGIDGFSVWEWNAIMPVYRRELPPPYQDGRRIDFWGNSPQRNWGLGSCDTIEDLRAHAWPKIGRAHV